MKERTAFVSRALLRAMREADSGADAGFARLREALSGEYRSAAESLRRDLATDDAIAEQARGFDPLAMALRSASLVRANDGRITADVWRGLERNHAAAIELSNSIRRSFTSTLIIAIATAAVAVTCAAVYLLFVLPQFEMLYASMRAELPFLTRLLLDGVAPLLMLLVIASVLVGAILLIVRPAWLRTARERAWNPAAWAKRVLSGSRVAKCHRRLAFVQYATALIDAGVAGRKALGIAAAESGAFGRIDFDANPDPMGRDELVSAVDHAERLGQLREELAIQGDLQAQALARAADAAQIRASFMIRGLLYALIGALVIAMYLPMFRLGAAI